jgi:4-nitrophenyl phosphatase
MDKSLQDIDAVVLDMDGVLWKGSDLLPGFFELFQMLDQRSIPYLTLTNNARKTPEKIQARFSANNVDIGLDQILTSAIGAAQYLSQELAPNSSIYVIGEEGLRQALIEAKFQVLNRSDNADAVVVGLDIEATWAKLAEATYAISAGARFIGTNPDGSIPTERGNAPGNGALLAAISTPTGKQAEIIGKPEPYLYNLAIQRLGTNASRTLAVGDRLNTDVLGGKRAGMLTALIMTGVTTREGLRDSEIQPDWVFDDLPHLIRFFES